jgi:hypothetical protein
MADWTDTATLIAALAAGKAVTDEKLQALAENPEAMAEGATGAPLVEGRALNTHMGAITQANAAPAGFVGLDRYELIVAWGHWDNAGGGRQFQIAFTNDNGASWGSNQNIFPLNMPASADAERLRLFRLNLRTGAYLLTNLNTGSYTGTVTPLADCNGFRIVGSVGSGMGFSADFFCLGGLTA